MRGHQARLWAEVAPLCERHLAAAVGGEAAAALPLGPLATFDTLVRLLDSYSRAVDSLAFVFGHQVRRQRRPAFTTPAGRG